MKRIQDWSHVSSFFFFFNNLILLKKKKDESVRGFSTSDTLILHQLLHLLISTSALPLTHPFFFSFTLVRVPALLLNRCQVEQMPTPLQNLLFLPLSAVSIDFQAAHL